MANPPTPMQIFGGSPFERTPELLLNPGVNFAAPQPSTAPSIPPPTVPTQANETNATEPRDTEALEKLRPESDLGRKVLAKLKAAQKMSQDEMSKHYARWRLNEQKVLAYSSITDYKAILEAAGTAKCAPQPMQITVPYSYATLHAAATFIASVLLGRKPLFPLIATRGTETDKARYMETALQAHIEYSRGYAVLWQFIWDSLLYDFAVTRNEWKEVHGTGIRIVAGQRTTTDELLFAGTQITCVDPYCFYPDPRVPIHEAPVRGDFIFTKMQISESILRDAEKAKTLLHVDHAISTAKATSARSNYGADDESSRRIKIGGSSSIITPANVTGFHDVYEGTIRIVPKDWGLGEADTSQLWKFAWLGDQIIQAEPLGMAHNQHPYSTAQPTSLGHEFMTMSMADMIAPFQDIISWVVSSRIENVRASVQNNFVADPARVEINDIRSSAIGRVIRLKQAAMGLPVREAIMQLPVSDVTQGHITDLQVLRTLADTITGVNDNMRGIQTAGGRRSATEARMSMQAGASRLSQLAILISSQAFMPMVSQMIMNIQQFMPDDMWVEMTGDTGEQSSLRMTPDMLVGSFNYQISDGSLPFDKTALVEKWTEILFGVARDPELRQQYDIGKIFNYVAELGGAKNIDSFKRQLPPQPAMPTQTTVGEPQPGQQPFAVGMPAGPSAML